MKEKMGVLGNPVRINMFIKQYCSLSVLLSEYHKLFGDGFLYFELGRTSLTVSTTYVQTRLCHWMSGGDKQASR